MSSGTASRSLRIAVVGGSIAGCSAAIELGRAGHEVTVFERAVGELVGRGAGIGTPLTTIDLMIERDLVDSDMPRFDASQIDFVARRDATDTHGHRALRLPLSISLFNWGDLWRNLRRRVPDTVYQAGVEVASVRADASEKATLALSDGTEREFDLVIFGDGYRSLARASLFPDVDLTYRGYVLWRGVREERGIADSEPLEGVLYRVGYKEGLAGHAVFYLVPGATGSVAPRERWVNFACYVPVPEADLPAFLVDRDGRQRQGSMPPGKMRLEEEARLKQLMADHVPGYFSDLVADARDTFAQPIYTVDMPAYHQGRVCLFGDAGALAQPFTGSGVFKATKNAIDLARELEAHGDVDAALSAWDRDETEAGKRLVVLGEQMERAFIWDAPDFSTMDGDAASAWWKASVTFPEDFNYMDE